MIKFNGGGFNNMGILALATPTVNFAQKRADKDRALQYEALLSSQKEQSRVQLQQEIAQQKAKYDEIRNLSVLAPDQNRINIVADELESAIKEKVKTKYGGNLQRYLQESADSDYEQYKKTIRSSDAYKDASSNKVSMAQYIEDQKAGKIPMLVGGRNANDVLSDFQSGRARQFSYQGGYMAPKDYAKRIQDSYGNDRFTKQGADPSRVILELQQDGLTLDQALDYYKQAGLDRNPIYHKYDDVFERQKMEQEAQARGLGLEKDKMSLLKDQASIAKMGYDMSKEKEAKEDKRFYDVTTLLGDANTQERRDWNGGKSSFAVSKPLTRTETTLATDLANANYDEKTGLFRMQLGRQMLSADGTATINGVTAFSNPRIVRRISDPKRPDLDELYLQVDGLMDEASAESDNAKVIKGKGSKIQSRFGSDDEMIGGSALIGKSDWDSTEDIYTLKDLLIPIDPSTAAGKAILNKKYGITGKAADAISQEANPALSLYED